MTVVTPESLAAELASCASAIEEACVSLDASLGGRRPQPGIWSIREHLSHLHGEDGYGYVDALRQVLFEDLRALDLEPRITHYTADRRDVALPVLISAVAGQYRAIANLAGHLSDDQLQIQIDVTDPWGSDGAPLALAAWLHGMATSHVAGHVTQIQETRAQLGA
jgi:hypothetical protein